MMLMMGQNKIESLIFKSTCPVRSFMALRRRVVKLNMRMISPLA